MTVFTRAIPCRVRGWTGVLSVKYICTFCDVYTYDEDAGDPETRLPKGTRLADVPDSWRCPVCGMPKTYLQPIPGGGVPVTGSGPVPQEGKKDLPFYRGIARRLLTGTCTVNPICDGQPGRFCIGQTFGAPIGLGGAGQGKTFGENYNALQGYRLRTRVVKAHHEPEMGLSVPGMEISAPVMGASLSGVKNSLNDAVPEDVFFRALLQGARAFGSIGMVGSAPTSPDDLGVTVVGEQEGWGIPVFKPQSQERLIQLFRRAEALDVTAIGMDLDGCGSTYWEKSRVFRKSEGELRELVDCTGKPVIFKGVMSVEDAGTVVDSGARVCYVSNHGGRVLDGARGVADVLPEIAETYRDRITIMADGAVRTGFDVLKVVALGAHVALIGRPLARMAIAGGADAVRVYLEYVKDDLRRAMILTGCDTLRDATRDILVRCGSPLRSG